MGWQQIKEEIKSDFVRSIKVYKSKGKSTDKVIKNYIRNIKAVNQHIKNNDICTIINI